MTYQEALNEVIDSFYMACEKRKYFTPTLKRVYDILRAQEIASEEKSKRRKLRKLERGI